MRSALRVHGFPALVDAIRTPPAWLGLERLDDAVNTVEMFVHTEDVRRANGMPVRACAADLEAALWRRLSRQARLMFRRARASVTLTADGFDPVTVGKGGPAVALAGRPGELLLFAFNRKEQADVTLTGPGADALRSARLGL
jgi:uncharacterized protein (TIGR03085 family)